VDWCKETGLSIIQLLPMNEVGSTFCPYDSISSFAIEPMYAAVRRSSFVVRRSEKTKIAHVDYNIKEKKLKLLRENFDSEKKLASNKEFNKFCAENEYWLDDLSLYKSLKAHHNGAAWYEWPDVYKNRDGEAPREFSKKNLKDLLFHKWVQWILFKQFRSAREYANSRGILLKGDLPILVSRDSADVWAHPDFFKLEYAAGAPPDMYCAKGQRWGMPTYNWDNIEADGFKYIKEKLRYAENFYDLLRIDHVVGLFRIWSIPYNDPLENQGLNGFFDPKDENVWPGHGRKLLSVIQDNTGMILCAEDLGVIPKACTDALNEMKIPGNDVQRWTKDWQVKHDFLDPEKYRALSVAMLSTHDTTNWAAWWENEAGTVDEALFIRKCNERGINYGYVKERLFDPARSKHGRLRWREDVNSVESYVGILGKRQEELKDFIEMYRNTYMEKEKLWKRLGLEGAMREKSDSRIVKEALKITSASNSIYCIELIFDLLYLSDLFKGDPYVYRVNSPGSVSPANWSLRIPIPLEELLKHEVNGSIRKIVSEGDR
jgi:4-alpha-glucanotransferase